MVEIKNLQENQWQLFKRLRIESITDAPHAFSTRLEDIQNRSDTFWQRLVRKYANDLDSTTCLVYLNGYPCGMAACIFEEDSAELVGLWVEPAFRRQGAAKAIIVHASGLSKERGLHQLKVVVFPDNLEAIEFYHSVGFLDADKLSHTLLADNREVLILNKHL